MTTITARTLLTDIGSVEYPVLTIAPDGTLADISSDPRSLATETDILTAAFLDIHIHGAVGHDLMSASPAGLAEVGRFLASHGTAHFLPTTVTASIDATLYSLERLADAIDSVPQPAAARPLGIHLEGPFLSHARRGVHPLADLQPPSIALFDRFHAAARGHILLLTIAPELPGALDLIRYATGKGVRCSLGHSDALAADTLTAITAGATSATHTFNAMRPLDHREPGILGTVLDDERLFAELICDGVHTDPALVRLWWKLKGPDRALLVTDAMAATGGPDGDYTLGGLPVRVQNGRALLAENLAHGQHTLAGSVLTLDRAVANLQTFTQAPLTDAVQAATTNPAALLGHPEWTRLAPGSPAHLNRFNAAGTLIATYINGMQAPRT